MNHKPVLTITDDLASADFIMRVGECLWAGDPKYGFFLRWEGSQGGELSRVPLYETDDEFCWLSELGFDMDYGETVARFSYGESPEFFLSSGGTTASTKHNPPLKGDLWRMQNRIGKLVGFKISPEPPSWIDVWGGGEIAFETQSNDSNECEWNVVILAKWIVEDPYMDINGFDYDFPYKRTFTTYSTDSSPYLLSIPKESRIAADARQHEGFIEYTLMLKEGSQINKYEHLNEEELNMLLQDGPYYSDDYFPVKIIAIANIG